MLFCRVRTRNRALLGDFVGVTGSGASRQLLSSSDDRQGIDDPDSSSETQIKASQSQIKIDITNGAIFSAAWPKENAVFSPEKKYLGY
jgi:hypothetical protein